MVSSLCSSIWNTALFTLIMVATQTQKALATAAVRMTTGGDDKVSYTDTNAGTRVLFNNHAVWKITAPHLI